MYAFPSYFLNIGKTIEPKYSGIRLLATRVLLIKWLLIREVANKGTELTQNIHLGPEYWLLTERY